MNGLTVPASAISPSQEHERREAFRKDLAKVLNRYSQENGSDTPEWILADYLIGCLNSWKNAARMRDRWWSFTPWGASPSETATREER